MRAIAVLCVVVVHVAFFADGAGCRGERLLLHLNVGVTIFFLISGFLLYRPFIAHRVSPAGRPRRRRLREAAALRILPGLLARR